MPFRRYVSIGRVAFVNLAEDPLYGKLVVIVDVVDQNRALVDSPEITRCVMNYKRLQLTDFSVEIERSPKKADLKKALESADVKGKWAASKWGLKLAQQASKKTVTDFERFKLMKARITRGKAIRAKVAAGGKK